MPPLPEYLQEVGRELIIPCEAAGDPAPNVTWSKVSETTYFSGSPISCAIDLLYEDLWLSSQIGPTPRSPFTVLSNGSLLLRPLSKDHHGGWECLATNRVATVSAGTVVMVLGKWVNFKNKKTVYSRKNNIEVNMEVNQVYLCSSGTSPHVVSSVTVTAELNQANVSWVPGFDGGFTQKFTVWLVSWSCLTVPSSSLPFLTLILPF